MTSRLPQRRIGPFDVGAVGPGRMGTTRACATHARDAERSAVPPTVGARS